MMRQGNFGAVFLWERAWSGKAEERHSACTRAGLSCSSMLLGRKFTYRQIYVVVVVWLAILEAVLHGSV